MKKTYITPAVCINAAEEATIIATSIGVGANTSDMNGKVTVDVEQEASWDIWDED